MPAAVGTSRSVQREPSRKVTLKKISGPSSKTARTTAWLRSKANGTPSPTAIPTSGVSVAESARSASTPSSSSTKQSSAVSTGRSEVWIDARDFLHLVNKFRTARPRLDSMFLSLVLTNGLADACRFDRRAGWSYERERDAVIAHLFP